MCSELATSKEHVPAKGLFPDKKDTSDNADLKRNLITVPSCHKHNGESSHDDQVFIYVLSMLESANLRALGQAHTKIYRSLNHLQNSSLMKKLLFNGLKIEEKIIDGKKTKKIRISLIHHYRQVEKCLEKNFMAIFWYKMEKRFYGTLELYTPFFITKDPIRNLDNLKIKFLSKKFLKDIPFEGANQEIFRYKINKMPNNQFIMEINFYEGIKAFAIFEEKYHIFL